MKFLPHQTHNAIVRVSFVCEFAQPFGEGLRAFEAAHPKFREDFPKLNLGQGFNIQLGAGGAPVHVPALAAVEYQDYDRDGQLKRSFQAQQVVLVFVHNRYTRWADIWSEARRILAAGLEIIPHAQLQAFGLEYVDRFTAPVAEGRPDVTRLFRRETQYLVPRIFDFPGIWHSHHGSLQEDIPDPQRHSKNDNINVDLIREQLPSPQFAINMVLRHRRVLAQAVMASASVSHLDVFMDEMHKTDKMMLGDMLTAEAAHEINLETDHG